LDEMEVVGHLLVVLAALGVLLAKDLGRRARVPGEEQQEVVLETEKGVLIDAQRPGLDLTGGLKAEARNAAVRRDVLILLADRFLQALELDVAGLFRELLRVDQVPSARAERL